MQARIARTSIVGLALIFSTTALYAGETQVSGFLRAAGAMSTGDGKYLEHIDKNGSTGDTHFGVNVAREVSDTFSVAGQLFASGSEGGEYAMKLDWAYASALVAPGLHINAGKIKFPNMLVSEYVDIGIAYPWIRPPKELYSFDAGSSPNISLESFVGASAIYGGFAGDLEYGLQVYGGESGVETGGVLSKMLGAKLSVGTDMFSVIGGYNMHMPEETMGEGGALAEKNDHSVSTISAGIKADWMNVLFMAEYAMGKVADLEDLDTTAMYATLGYHIGSIMPHFTYAKRDAEEGTSSMIFGVKYQMTPASTMKMEYQQVTPDSEEVDPFSVISVAMDVVF